MITQTLTPGYHSDAAVLVSGCNARGRAESWSRARAVKLNASKSLRQYLFYSRRGWSTSMTSPDQGFPWLSCTFIRVLVKFLSPLCLVVWLTPALHRFSLCMAFLRFTLGCLVAFWKWKTTSYFPQPYSMVVPDIWDTKIQPRGNIWWKLERKNDFLNLLFNLNNPSVVNQICGISN